MKAIQHCICIHNNSDSNPANNNPYTQNKSKNQMTSKRKAQHKCRNEIKIMGGQKNNRPYHTSKHPNNTFTTLQPPNITIATTTTTRKTRTCKHWPRCSTWRIGMCPSPELPLACFAYCSPTCKPRGRFCWQMLCVIKPIGPQNHSMGCNWAYQGLNEESDWAQGGTLQNASRDNQRVRQRMYFFVSVATSISGWARASLLPQ